MPTLQHVVDYLNELLQPELFHDYCPNGLQVAGRHEVKKIITGVTACQDLLDAAVKQKADALLVHHGYFWKGEDPCLVGVKRQRLATLLNHDISLLAYHLPLDAHPEFGNNRQLACCLGIETEGEFAQGRNPGLACLGRLNKPMSGDDFVQHITHHLQREPLHISGRAKRIETIAWCTGAAQDFIEEAAAEGVDAYLTGEVSERTVHVARETGLHFFAAGHHATERFGVQALGDHIAQQLKVECEFVDVPNPV